MALIIPRNRRGGEEISAWRRGKQGNLDVIMVIDCQPYVLKTILSSPPCSAINKDARAALSPGKCKNLRVASAFL